jgi:hypothetical protein
VLTFQARSTTHGNVRRAGKLRNWAEQPLNERTYNRGDDDLGPIELPREPKT